MSKDQVYFQSPNKMYLAVLKTRPHEYLLDIFLDKYLSIYFLADLQTGYFFPLLIFLSCLLDTYKNTHSCTNKHRHTYKNTIRHQASHIAKENWSEIFAFSLCSNITWNPASHIRIGYICEINLKFTKFNLLASTSAMASFQIYFSKFRL